MNQRKSHTGENQNIVPKEQDISVPLVQDVPVPVEQDVPVTVEQDIPVLLWKDFYLPEVSNFGLKLVLLYNREKKIRYNVCF